MSAYDPKRTFEWVSGRLRDPLGHSRLLSFVPKVSDAMIATKPAVAPSAGLTSRQKNLEASSGTCPPLQTDDFTLQGTDDGQQFAFFLLWNIELVERIAEVHRNPVELFLGNVESCMHHIHVLARIDARAPSYLANEFGEVFF